MYTLQKGGNGRMKTARLRYFAACNSEEGFHSFYKDVFTSDLEHIYIIKGGPGTGKSSLMRRVADRAEEKGYRVEEIYCSSDPASLDGVIAHSREDSFAILDGTAPHVTEMELPGARDELLYVGDFWSSETLREQKEDILRESLARAEGYRRLYRYLRAAGQCERNMESTASVFLNHHKMKDTVSRILSKYPVGVDFSEKTMLTSSIGMRGIFRFATLEEASDTVFRVVDCAGTARYMFDEIFRQAHDRRMRVWVSYDPLIPTRMDGICLPDYRLSFVNAGRAEKGEEGRSHRLSMKRYIFADGYRSVQDILITAQKNKDRLMTAALETLQQIRELHFAIESRYVSAMDFDAMQAYTDRWLSRILP